MSDAYDILILGGGLVGCSLACALQGRGYRIGLVEGSAPQASPPGFDERKLALAAASLQALAVLHVLERLATEATPIRRIHVSRAGDFGSVRLQAKDFGRECFGGVVLARELGEALAAQVDACSDVDLLRPAQVVAAGHGADCSPEVELQTANGLRRVRCRLLVAADGARSLARAALGIGCQEHDYRQVLFVCSLQCERASDGQAYERFSDQGPVALLPMSGGAYGAVCAVASEDAARVAALDDAGFADYFQQRFGWRAGRVRRVGARSRYPLLRVVAERLDAPRALLMGNAAQAIHPIGAQGFNLGLRDALTLAERLDGGDPGRAEVLADYVAARREDRERTLAFSDGLARLTAAQGLLPHAMRSFGLLALAHVPGLAAPLVAGAMGYRGQVPALARSVA
ncbi:MAG TPA: 2-octaprenyl-6-methoxyphenyl hydroxylase [Arenimonas sp.]|nr:2-octaprenyl-6-methoxyphenyl hydroxylase [Arenimonas sp.]